MNTPSHPRVACAPHALQQELHLDGHECNLPPLTHDVSSVRQRLDQQRVHNPPPVGVERSPRGIAHHGPPYDLAYVRRSALEERDREAAGAHRLDGHGLDNLLKDRERELLTKIPSQPIEPFDVVKLAHEDIKPCLKTEGRAALVELVDEELTHHPRHSVKGIRRAVHKRSVRIILLVHAVHDHAAALAIDHLVGRPLPALSIFSRDLQQLFCFRYPLVIVAVANRLELP